MRQTLEDLCIAMSMCALAAAGTVSCKRTKLAVEPEKPIENKYNAGAVCYGAAADTADVNLYVLTLSEKGLEVNQAGVVKGGDGKAVEVQFFSRSANEPAEGEYKVKDDAADTYEDFAILPGILSDRGFGGSCILEYEDGEITAKEQVLAVPKEGEGSMTLNKTRNGWKVAVKFKYPDGDEAVFEYEGQLKFLSALEAAFVDEPDEAPGAVEYAEAVLVPRGLGMFRIQMTTEDGKGFAKLILFESESVTNAKECYGKSYPIDQSMKNGSVLGCGEDVQMNMSWMYVDMTVDENGYITGGKKYHFVSGTVDISANGMVSIDAVSGKGHTMKLKSTTPLGDIKKGKEVPAKMPEKSRFERIETMRDRGL